MTAEHHQGCHHDHASAGRAVDPVCGMTVDPHTAKHRADDRGHTYYFCSAGCRTKFVNDPQKYLGERKPEPVVEGAIYTCPMHPQIRQVGPGSCPICGMPATYAAVRACFEAVADVRPDFAPQTALDIGAGPGTALWAASGCWPRLADAELVEASPVFRAYGERLAAKAELPRITWRVADVAAETIDCGPRDLVSLAYVLNELVPAARQSVLRKLWALTADTLVVVEPGTPAGWQRILAARSQLIEAGAHVIAPCPHVPSAARIRSQRVPNASVPALWRLSLLWTTSAGRCDAGEATTDIGAPNPTRIPTPAIWRR